MVGRHTYLIWWLVGGVTLIILAVLLVMVFIGRPDNIGFARGAVKIHEASLDGRAVVVIDGSPSNYLGQIQGVGVRWEGRRVYVDQFVVRWHPLARITTHSDWPIVFRKDELDSGTYEVYYRHIDDGYIRAGEFVVAARSARGGPP